MNGPLCIGVQSAPTGLLKKWASSLQARLRRAPRRGRRGNLGFYRGIEIATAAFGDLAMTILGFFNTPLRQADISIAKYLYDGRDSE